MPAEDVGLFKQADLNITTGKTISTPLKQSQLTTEAFFEHIKATLEATAAVNTEEDASQRAAQRATQEAALNTKVARASTDEAYYEAQIELYTLQLRWANEDGNQWDVADLTTKLANTNSHLKYELYSKKTTELRNRLYNLDWNSVAYKELEIELNQTHADYYTAQGDTGNADYYSGQVRACREGLERARTREAGMQTNIPLNREIDALRAQQNDHFYYTIEWLEYEVQIQRLTAQCHTNLNETYYATTAETNATRYEQEIARLRREAEELLQEEALRQREEAMRAAALGLGVHDGNRDALTVQAFQTLLRHQQDVDPAIITEEYDDFIAVVNALPLSERTTRIKQALGLEDVAAPGCFKGFLNPDEYLPYELTELATKEGILGHLWYYAGHFATNLPGLTEEQKALEHASAKTGVLSALNDSFNDYGALICNLGKLQRMATAVLQGRLAGVAIDNEATVSPGDTTTLFQAAWEKHKRDHPADTITRLYIQAFENEFKANNPNVDEPALTACFEAIYFDIDDEDSASEGE
jgi:hypothetical protein